MNENIRNFEQMNVWVIESLFILLERDRKTGFFVYNLMAHLLLIYELNLSFIAI